MNVFIGQAVPAVISISQVPTNHRLLHRSVMQFIVYLRREMCN
jgi:hypothetical protein